MERKFGNTLEFFGELFDQSVKQLIDQGGRRDLNVLIDPPKALGNAILIHKAAVITFPNGYAPNSQFSLTVLQRNFYEHPSYLEFNIIDQALSSGRYLEKDSDETLSEMIKDARQMSAGYSFGLFGDVQGSSLYLTDEVNPDQFYLNEANKPIIDILNQMKSLTYAIKVFPEDQRLNESVMESCVGYTDLVRRRSAASRPFLKSLQSATL